MTDREMTAESSEELAERIFTLLGHQVNLSSPRMVAVVLADELGLPLTERNKVAVRVDSATLEQLQAEHPHEVVDLLLRWRMARSIERERSVSGAPASLKNEIDYEEIARLMGVEAQTVRVYAVRDPDFPPVVAMVGRTPLRSRKAVERYIAMRGVRRIGRAGRAPAAIEGSDRLEVNAAMNQRIRTAVEKAGVTFAELARLVKVSPNAIWMRLEGRSRWRRSELETIAERLGVPVDELVSEPAPARPRRGAKTAK